jgi:acetylornithine deacetylase/succinyl-diaminopimelate desuccinylase-like protein
MDPDETDGAPIPLDPGRRASATLAGVSEDLRRAVADGMSSTREGLERLVRIPSVSAPGFEPHHVRRSAELTADLLGEAGLHDVRFLEIPGAHPAVFGQVPAPAGTPTVLLYAHHDVQPPGDDVDWESPPFEPVERDGRLYGRGTADDKAGVMVHASALRAHEGAPPVGVKVFIEGEEEIGSINLAAFLSRYRAELAADVIVLADSDNWRVGQPALTISLRGLVDCVVEVRTLDHAVHSGFMGGVFPDALSALSRLLASLHDEAGNVAIPGLVTGDADPLDLTEEEIREQAGALPEVDTIGQGNLTARMWTRPAVSVLGIDAPTIARAANQLVPVARAKVSLRLAPGEDPAAAMRALRTHLESRAPWGARVTVEPGAVAAPFSVEAKGPAYDAARWAFEEAWGVAPLDTGGGGTIPFIADFQEAFPEAAILVTGVEDPDTRAHGANESLHLDDWARACVAEALLLRRLAEPV